MSLLLDVYGDLLTEKQRHFMRLYFEQDLSFGEIAQEHGVSRQAIFGAVKQGEDALEGLEGSLRLVDSGWTEWVAGGLTPRQAAERLTLLRGKLDGAERSLLRELDRLIEELRGPGVDANDGE